MMNKLMRQVQKKTLLQINSMAFSGGPYNPLAYKALLVPETLPT